MVAVRKAHASRCLKNDWSKLWQRTNLLCDSWIVGNVDWILSEASIPASTPAPSCRWRLHKPWLSPSHIDLRTSWQPWHRQKMLQSHSPLGRACGCAGSRGSSRPSGGVGHLWQENQRDLMISIKHQQSGDGPKKRLTISPKTLQTLKVQLGSP